MQSYMSPCISMKSHNAKDVVYVNGKFLDTPHFLKSVKYFLLLGRNKEVTSI